MLHLVQSRNGLVKCKQYVQPGDDVVFIGDGVICVASVAHCRVHVSDEDAIRFGIEIGETASRCSMSDLVELVALHHNSASWR